MISLLFIIFGITKYYFLLVLYLLVYYFKWLVFKLWEPWNLRLGNNVTHCLDAAHMILVWYPGSVPMTRTRQPPHIQCHRRGPGHCPAAWPCTTLITRRQGIVPLSTADGLVWYGLVDADYISYLCDYVCSCKMLISVVWISSFFMLGVVGHLVWIDLSVSIHKFLAKG
jgi:hypothetical protein